MDASLRKIGRSLSTSSLAAVPDFRLGEARVSPSRRKIFGPSGSTDLQPRVMQVLVALAENEGRVVSRATLLDRCWGGMYVGDDSLNRVVAVLRKAAAHAAANSFEIETVPRIGYRLVEKKGQDQQHRGVRFLTPLLVCFFGIAVLAVVAGTIWLTRSPSEAPRPKVAVLPFAALDSGSEDTNLGASIAVSVTNALAQTGIELPEGLRSAEEARRLGAQVIVSGTLRREGPVLRVTTRVSSALDRSTILSTEFEESVSAPSSIADRVAVWLTPPTRMWASFFPVEADAHVRQEILRIFLTREAHQRLRAWELARTLARAKPRSGAAQLVAALLTSDALAEIESGQRAAAVTEARLAATRAAHQLPDPARALAVRDCHLVAPGWKILTPLCDQRTRAAIAQNPDVPLIPFLFGWQLAGAGRFVEAAKFADMDLAQSPLGPGQLLLRIFVQRMTPGAEDMPQLEEKLRRVDGDGGLPFYEYQAAISDGDFTKANSLLNPTFDKDHDKNARESPGPIADGDELMAMNSVIRAVLTKSPRNVALMRRTCNPTSGERALSDPLFGTCLVGLTVIHDLDGAFALAKGGYPDVACCGAVQQEQRWLGSGGEYNLRWELFGKAMAPLRADRRFIELARRTGLLSYWATGHQPDFCTTEHVPVCLMLQRR